MAIQIPVKYSALLQKTLEAKLTAKLLFNSSYEGEIKKVGDRVKIPFVKRPRTQTYTPGSALTIDNAAMSFDELVVNQAKGFTARVENFDEEANEVNISAKLIEEGAKGFAIDVDKYLIGLHSEVAAPNILGSSGSPIEVDKDNAADVVSELIATIRDKGTQGQINVLVPSLVSQYFPVSLQVTTPQPEIQAMGIEQGFQINGGMVYPSPLTKQYIDDTAADTIDGAISETDTVITVDDATGFSAGQIVKIDNELMYIVSIDTLDFTVIRGVAFTDVVAHDDGVAIKAQKESNIIFAADPMIFGSFAQKSSRLKIVDQIKGEDAIVIQSFLYYGAKVLNGLAGGVAYVTKAS